MRKTTPTRTPEQRATDYTSIVERPRQCNCAHHLPIVCESKQINTSIFNLKMQGDSCYCLCHQDSNGNQISEHAWNVNKARQQGKVSA